MTEKQYKKCEEISNLYKNSGLLKELILRTRIFEPVFYLRWIKITMLLAKVFNKNITKKEAKEIVININNNVGALFTVDMLINLTFNSFIFWGIANYLDDGTINGFIPNYKRDKNFKEIKKDNENNKEIKL